MSVLPFDARSPRWIDEVERSVRHGGVDDDSVDAAPLIVDEQPTGPTQPLGPIPPPGRWHHRASAFFWSWLAPLGLTFVTLDRLAPSRMEAGGALPTTFARAFDEHPLWMMVVLFALFSLTIAYWRRQWCARLGTKTTSAGLAARRPATLPRRHVAGWAVGLAALSALALLTPARLSQVDRVAGSSMVPTLNPGDRVLVNEVAYGFKVPFTKRVLGARLPRRGEIIVFPSAGHIEGGPQALVKRVIGLPGDLVTFRDGSPIVNGWVVPSCDAGPYLAVAGRSIIRGRLTVEALGDRVYLTIRRPFDEPELAGYRVPPGEVFVVGDDRGTSSDSRTWNQGRGGSVRIDEISGRVSRLALGRFRDGRLDLHRPFAPLRPRLREPTIDLSKTDERIAGCLSHPPTTSWPPPPAGDHAARK